MTSQLVIFRAFLFIFFRSPDPKSEKKNVNQLIKKFWPWQHFVHINIRSRGSTYQIKYCILYWEEVLLRSQSFECFFIIQET